MNQLRFRSGVAIGLLLGLAACGAKSPDAPPPVAAASTAAPELGVVELGPGSGAPIVSGQKATVQYTGWLYETSAPDHKGKEFDSSRNSGQPFSFVVGAGQVIKGWDQGVLGMRVGGRRRLTIPPELGYGDIGAGGVIPPGAALIFDVELVAVQ